MLKIFPSVLVDEAHGSAWTIDPADAAVANPVNPADASYARGAALLRERGYAVTRHRSGPWSGAALAGTDVLVIAHPAVPAAERVACPGSPVYSVAELDALESFVRDGGGLVVLAECDQDSSGSNLGELLARFGVRVVSTTVQEGAAGGRRHNGVASWVLPELGAGGPGSPSVLAGVDAACFYRAGVLDLSAQPDAVVLARTTATAHPAAAPLAAVAQAGAGRIAVFADSDLFGDDSIEEFDHEQLWFNVVTWAARQPEVAPSGASVSPVTADEHWPALKAAVVQLRAMQGGDGAIDRSGDPAGHDLARAAQLVDQVAEHTAALATHLPHDAAYLDVVVRDLRAWADAGFGVPDFLDSLLLFRPDTHRVDGTEHLVLFPMYTQNGNPSRQLEALVIRVSWPDWLAEVESRYDNPMFLPVTFVDFTPGYDTNSAVLFPETVAVREVPRFHWGAIFCDREAARFRRVAAAAVALLRLDLPPDAERLLASQPLAQDTFAMWDLIHDRTHSHGDLPFDPFMIKQRMPFWLYALEELRCDLNSFREAWNLEREGHPYARAVQHAIVLDRLFRFPITGPRVRNYDGLGGQLLFAYLHRNDVLRWTDNTLRCDWSRLPAAVVDLCEEVEKLYRDGIDRAKTAHWLASYQLVSRYVAPNPSSAWAGGVAALPMDGPLKALVDAVLPDEFPLSVFYEALRKKLADVVDSTSGITAAGA
ncbi:MAG TPA: DUF6421 family protein [Dermatophilaceae bacterium]|nr:DUF6421 family protein [Dermatophilaceae bacterium]